MSTQAKNFIDLCRGEAISSIYLVHQTGSPLCKPQSEERNQAALWLQ